jgi:ferredoxin
MARAGQIAATRSEDGLVFGALPFVFGIYEYQVGVLDKELAQLFEDYYREAFGQELAIQPPIHRVIPVEESVQVGLEIRPYESAVEILDTAKAWGVLDCICRKQKALIGDPCHHPIDTCLPMSDTPGAFEHNPVIRALTRDEAVAVLQRAAEAGLVHSVNNAQQDVTYVCNCCTCSCGILRGIADLGIANVVARSAFVAQVDEGACVGCDLCLDRCQFGALSLDGTARVDESRCVGCGVCAPACPEKALILVRRPTEDVLQPPQTEAEWRRARAEARGIDLGAVL